MSTNQALRTVCELIRQLGTNEDTPGGFAADFNNVILGSPYLEGTGWLPDRETAEGVAAFIIPALNGLALAVLTEDPDAGFGWTDPEEVAQESYATIISFERDANEEPVVEDGFYGDEWLLASVSLGLLDPDQKRLVEKITALLTPTT